MPDATAAGCLSFVVKHLHVMGKLDDSTGVTDIIPGIGKTRVLGDVNVARAIAQQAVALVERFCHAVVHRDYPVAYGLCAAEFRARATLERFTELIAKGEEFAQGNFIDFSVDKITWIYADDVSRNESNKDGQWPKDTPKQNKRCYVGTFWFCNKDTQEGCYGLFWITEEKDGYKAAKFSFED